MDSGVSHPPRAGREGKKIVSIRYSDFANRSTDKATDSEEHIVGLDSDNDGCSIIGYGGHDVAKDFGHDDDIKYISGSDASDSKRTYLYEDCSQTSDRKENIEAQERQFQNSQDGGAAKRIQKHPATFQCTLCPKRFTRSYNLRSHRRTHNDERPFMCTVCGKAFARQWDHKKHESLHYGEKKFVCKGDHRVSGQWGCGRRFARIDALRHHVQSEAGQVCIKPWLDEEMLDR